MKILHVNMSMDSEKGGGTVERVMQLHNALIKQNVESHVLTMKTSDKDDKQLSQDITVLRCLNKRWFIPFPEMNTVKKLIEWADVIHIVNHWTVINMWIYFLAKKQGKPYVFSPAGALTIFGRSKVKKYFYQKIVGKNILQNASAVIAISSNEVKVMKQWGVNLDKIHHLPNGVSESDFSYLEEGAFRELIGIDDTAFILFVGRLNEIKGPDLLLSAFAELKNNKHHLVFVGPDDGLEIQLKKQVIDLKLQDKVHFSGYLAGDMKSSAYHGADLLVVPSRYDAMSIVALEAAISGTPVLLTDQCGFSSLANAGAAIEVSASVEGIVEGINTLISNAIDLKQMGEKGYDFAYKNYSSAMMAEQFIKISCSVI